MSPKLSSLMGVFILMFASIAQAADHYIRDGAAGSTTGVGDCSSWEDAHACDQLPSTLVRGDTYYVADGSYSGKDFNTSGTALITVKKATGSVHGSDVGWQAAFGEGSATFTTTLKFSSSNWLLDGASGGGPNNWTGPFGFRSTATNEMLVYDNGAAGVTVQHIELAGVGAYNGLQVGLRAGSCTNCSLSHWYMHDLGLIPFFSGASNLVVEFGYMKNWYGGVSHSELCSCWAIGSAPIGTHTFRYNLFTDIRSTGGLMWDNSTNHAAELRVYGNVFYKDPAVPMDNQANGVIGGWTGGNGEDFYNARVYNNSFINITGAQILSTLPIRSGSNAAQNNLFYSIQTPGGGSTVWQTVSHSHFISTGSIGTNATTSTGDPFVDLAAFKFSLKAGTPAGMALMAPYNVDMFGKVRGADGTWDRGAVEFGPLTLAPSVPTTLKVQ